MRDPGNEVALERVWGTFSYICYILSTLTSTCRHFVGMREGSVRKFKQRTVNARSIFNKYGLSGVAITRTVLSSLLLKFVSMSQSLT